MSHVARCSFRQNKAKRVHRATAVRVAHEVQPQKRKGEAAFHGIRGLPVRNGKDSEVRGTAAEKAARIIARDGMFEIGRSSQGLERFIGKLFRQKTTERAAKCFAREVALGALKLHTNKFETVGLGAAESLDGKRETLLGMVSDGQHPARQIVIFGPEVQERLFRGTTNFPGESGERSHASAILANLNGAIGGEFLETSLQFEEEVHAKEYKGNN